MAIAARACIQVAGSARSGMPARGGDGELEVVEAPDGAGVSRKDRRRALKKQKRKQIRRELAIRERDEEAARANDPEERIRIRLKERDEAEAAERERKAFEEHERLWLEAAAVRRAEEEEKREEELRRNRLLQEAQKNEVNGTDELNGGSDDDWEYAEEGPAEIIWKGNEIIVKKKRVRVKKIAAYDKELDDRPTSNPLPPQSSTFKAFNCLGSASAGEMLESVANQVPNFGTEQDKAHCPFHLKTGACRFGLRCSRVHFYPDKSCTLLIKNMYNGPGIVWEQDEGLEYTDEEVEHCYEDFYEDVHTEFLKFGELVNFKVCRNSSFHLRGNVYIQYKNLESAILAYNTMSGRYYAGKQIICEFVNITRWKVAICGEYMKSRLKTCSHGSACNFIHCFYNPGGDYEWADWDSPPPRYWVKKMAALFGFANIPRHDMGLELENELLNEDKRRTRRDRHRSRQDKYKEVGLSGSSGEEISDGAGDRYRRGASYSRQRRSRSRDRRTVEHCSPEVEGTERSRHSYDPGEDTSLAMGRANDRGSSCRENRRKDRAEHSRRGHYYSGGDDMSDAEDRDSSFRDRRRKSRGGSSWHSHQSYESGDAMSKAEDGDSSRRERSYAGGSRIEEHTRKRISDSTSRSLEKTSGGVRGKSGKKSTHRTSPVWSSDGQEGADVLGRRSRLDDRDGVAASGGSGCSSYERRGRRSDLRKEAREHAARSSDGADDSHGGRSKKHHG